MEIDQERDLNVCQSCEALKLEMARLHDQNNELISSLTKPINQQEAKVDTSELKPISPRSMPWGVRRQMLEAEDRAKAKIMRDQQKERQEAVAANAKTELAPVMANVTGADELTELEKELGVVNGD